MPARNAAGCAFRATSLFGGTCERKGPQAPLGAGAVTYPRGRSIRLTACAARLWLRKFFDPSFDVGPDACHRDTPGAAHDETLQLAGIHESI